MGKRKEMLVNIFGTRCESRNFFPWEIKKIRYSYLPFSRNVIRNSCDKYRRQVQIEAQDMYQDAAVIQTHQEPAPQVTALSLTEFKKYLDDALRYMV